jgi:hypothetical protein
MIGPLPPSLQACYWLTNVTQCKDEQIHRAIVALSVATNIVPSLVGLYIIWRRRNIWRGLFCTTNGCFSPSPVECLLVVWTLASFLSSIFLLIIALNLIDNPVLREVLLAIRFWPCYCGIVLFLSGLFASLSISLMRESTTYTENAISILELFTIWTPSQKTIQRFTILMMSWEPLIVLPLRVCNGLAQQYGQWQLAEKLNQAIYLIVSSQLFILSVVAGYFGRRLFAVLRDSERRAYSPQMMTQMVSGVALIRFQQSAKRMRSTFLRVIFACGASAILSALWGLAYKEILAISPLSIAMNIIVNVLWNITIMGFVLCKIYKGTKAVMDSSTEPTHCFYIESYDQFYRNSQVSSFIKDEKMSGWRYASFPSACEITSGRNTPIPKELEQGALEMHIFQDLQVPPSAITSNTSNFGWYNLEDQYYTRSLSHKLSQNRLKHLNCG